MYFVYGVCKSVPKGRDMTVCLLEMLSKRFFHLRKDKDERIFSYLECDTTRFPIKRTIIVEEIVVTL